MPARQQLCHVVELLQCALLPCLSSGLDLLSRAQAPAALLFFSHAQGRSLAAMEGICKELRKTIVAGMCGQDNS